ncbi:MAG: GTPase HflX [Lentisphaeria bacterium]
MNLHEIQYERGDSRFFEKAYVVAVRHVDDTEEQTCEFLRELKELVETLGIGICGEKIIKLTNPRPKYLLGSGKAEEIVRDARDRKADVIILDDPLSPSQQRNWEKLAKMPVIDRQEVILDIFGERAQTRAAELQISLARSEYDLPRLKRRWTHLSRQRGGTTGGAGLRGGGEQQIEVDARLVKDRISHLKKELEEVRRKRHVQRQRRLKKPVPTAALVGYTNAGKSSLLNGLTDSNVFTEDKLFATLDPTSRRVVLPNRQEIIISDTVGFIRKLPHSLIESFKATLEEAILADYIIEVLDVTSDEIRQHHETTSEVLKELGAENKPRIIVLNKIDLVRDSYTLPRCRKFFGKPVFTSARKGEGFEALEMRLGEELHRDLLELNYLVPHSRYDLVALLHRTSLINYEESTGEGVWVHASVPEYTAAQLKEFEINHESSLTKV